MAAIEQERKRDKLKSNFESMKSQLLQVMEELKMRRKNDHENEEKMNKLITEKFELKKLKEEEISNLNDTIQNLKQENIQLHKVYEEKKKAHEEEKTAQSMTINSSSKGISSLKDEILTLQLTKFGLEKKVKDMEHQLQVEASNKNELLHRVKDVDKTIDSLQKQFKQLADRLDYLSSLVVKTEEMHKKLMQFNEHQKSLLSNQQQEMMKCQKEISIKAALLKKLQRETSHVITISQSYNNKENDNKENLKLKDQFEKEIESVKQQKKFLMTSLSETNQLLMSVQSKYEHSNNLNASLQMDIDELKTSQMECTEKLESSTKENISLKEQLYNENQKLKETEERYNMSVENYERKLNTLLKEAEQRMRSKDLSEKEVQTTWLDVDIKNNEKLFESNARESDQSCAQKQSNNYGTQRTVASEIKIDRLSEDSTDGMTSLKKTHCYTSAMDNFSHHDMSDMDTSPHQQMSGIDGSSQKQVSGMVTSSQQRTLGMGSSLHHHTSEMDTFSHQHVSGIDNSSLQHMSDIGATTFTDLFSKKLPGEYTSSVSVNDLSSKDSVFENSLGIDKERPEYKKWNIVSGEECSVNTESSITLSEKDHEGSTSHLKPLSNLFIHDTKHLREKYNSSSQPIMTDDEGLSVDNIIFHSQPTKLRNPSQMNDKVLK